VILASLTPALAAKTLSASRLFNVNTSDGTSVIEPIVSSFSFRIVSNCDDDVVFVTRTRLAEDTVDAVPDVVGAAISSDIGLYEAMAITDPSVRQSPRYPSWHPFRT